MHSVDLVPTILRLAGHPALTGLDGVDQWDAVVSGGERESPRDWMVYNMDDVFVPNFLAGPRPQQQKFQVLHHTGLVWSELVSNYVGSDWSEELQVQAGVGAVWDVVPRLQVKIFYSYIL